MVKPVYFLYFVIMTCCIQLFFSSCNNEKRRIKEALISMQNQTVYIPLNEMVCINKDSTDELLIDSICKYKIVMYIDSSYCTPCALNKLNFWKDLIAEYKNKVNFFFIIAPPRDQQYYALSYFETNKFDSPIYIDTSYVFSKSNIQDLRQNLFSTVLLDNNSPLKIYQSVMQSYAANQRDL